MMAVRKNNVRQRFASRRKAILFATMFVCVFASMLGATLWGAPPLPAQIQTQAQGQKWMDQLPDGTGRDLVAANCIICHTLERVVTSHRPRVAWETLVKVMVLRGCPIDDDQVATGYRLSLEELWAGA